MKMLTALQILAYLVVAYLFCLLFMYFRQESFIFFPPKDRHQGHGEPKVVDYQLERPGATLRGWLVNPELVGDKLIIYYGGNAEDVFLNIDEYRDIRAASLFVSYRGYGPSDGRPGEKQLFADSLAVIDDIRHRYAPQNIYLIGRSLGSGVACYVAGRRKVQGAVLITPYDSIEKIASAAYPWLPVSMLLKHRFESFTHVKRIISPLLVIYGGEDQVIPPESTRKLIEHIVGEKEVVYLERADHGNVDMYPAYWQAIISFINRGEEVRGAVRE